MKTDEIVETLINGGVVLFPTDTVWGVGVYINSKIGMDKLYKIKNRSANKPTAVLVGSMDQAKTYGVFEKESLDLVNKHWPGELTVVVKARSGLDERLINVDGGVGIRYPNNELIEELCRKLSGGLVASSANVAGEKAPVKFEEIDKQLLNMVDEVIMGESGSGKSSTVVNCMDNKMTVLRQGDVRL